MGTILFSTAFSMLSTLYIYSHSRNVRLHIPASASALCNLVRVSFMAEELTYEPGVYWPKLEELHDQVPPIPTFLLICQRMLKGPRTLSS